MKIGLVVAALLVTLTACGGGDADSEDALTKAAQEQADRYTSGDFAGAWDMWTDDAKGVMSEADYVTFAKECAGTGMPLDVAEARIEDDGTGTVRLALGDFASSYSMEYEGDAWSWVPNDDSLAMYERGAQGAIDAATEGGSCVNG